MPIQNRDSVEFYDGDHLLAQAWSSRTRGTANSAASGPDSNRNGAPLRECWNKAPASTTKHSK